MTLTWTDVNGQRLDVFFSFYPSCCGGLGWRIMAAGSNVSSQETRGCRQGNESHGVTSGILHAWLVFCWPGRTRCTVTCFLLPSVSLASGGCLSQNKHVARTEYAFKCTCSRMQVLCALVSVALPPSGPRL